MKIRMMLVEDEERLRTALRDFFEGAGYEVDDAGTFAAACDLLAAAEYDVVIADLRLSSDNAGMEGLELIRRARLRCPAIRTILLTAVPPFEIMRAHLDGVDALLQKPQPLAEVARVVRELLG
jgi:CheY-like chemotaxis protein